MIPTYSRNVALTVNSVSTARPPSSKPTAMAAGRFRPVLARLGAGGGAGSGGVPGCRSASCCTSATLARQTGGRQPRSLAERLDLEELCFLVLQQLVDLRSVCVRQVIQLTFGPATLVLASLTALHQLVDRVLAVPADVADRHPAVLGLRARDLDVVPASLLGQLGEGDPDDQPVVGRVDAEIGVPDRLLDGRERALVVGLHDHHAGLGQMERRQLVHRRQGPVVLSGDLVEHRRVSPAGPDASEVLLGNHDRLLHLLLGFEEGVVNHCGSSAYVGRPVTVGPGACSALVNIVYGAPRIRAAATNMTISVATG